jgi:23S rRNA pseudouridine1911/1915/1917 synthase
VDVVLGSHPEIGSRSRAAALLEAGLVQVNGVVVAKSRLLESGDRVAVVFPELDSLPVPGEEAAAPTLAVPILYEDEWLLVVDKPAGMAVHPAPGHAEGTLVQVLAGHGLTGGEDFRPGVVHRLDKDTSGLLVVAKDPAVQRALAALISRRQVRRHYLALVHGGFKAQSGTIDAPVGRDPVRRKSMTVGGVAARVARTHFSVRERLGDYTLVEVRLETGRTHQIRVHFLAIGHPVAGDPVYARHDPLGLGRQFLHSHRLAFVHPATGVSLEFESPLPSDLAAVLERLRAEHAERHSGRRPNAAV